jgi:hypothetical protein
MLSFQGELILAVTYGYRKYERDDGLLADSKRRIKFASDKIHPGASLINHVPLCMCFFCFLILCIGNLIDLAHTLQYATFLIGYRGSATNHWYALVSRWEIRSYILLFKR